MSTKYTGLMLRLLQNEHYRAFGMVAAGTSVIHAAKVFGCSTFNIVHSIVKQFELTGISIDALSRGDVKKRRRGKTVNLLLRINVSSSGRQL